MIFTPQQISLVL